MIETGVLAVAGWWWKLPLSLVGLVGVCCQICSVSAASEVRPLLKPDRYRWANTIWPDFGLIAGRSTLLFLAGLISILLVLPWVLLWRSWYLLLMGWPALVLLPLFLWTTGGIPVRKWRCRHGYHQFQRSCTCAYCGQQHKWRPRDCRCANCGKPAPPEDERHNWNGCTCPGCGLTRDTDHQWEGCKCLLCGATRKQAHEWDGCLCRRCGAKRNEAHHWDRCLCRRCGAKAPADSPAHDWIRCQCRRCGAVRAGHHAWDGCVCRQCGAERHEYEWRQSSKGHARAGTPAYFTHSGGHYCKRCGQRNPATANEDRSWEAWANERLS